jgi:hypothetical protein
MGNCLNSNDTENDVEGIPDEKEEIYQTPVPGGPSISYIKRKIKPPSRSSKVSPRYRIARIPHG